LKLRRVERSFPVGRPSLGRSLDGIAELPAGQPGFFAVEHPFIRKEELMPSSVSPAALCLGAVLLFPGLAFGQTVHASLNGYEEITAALGTLSTPAVGQFSARIDERNEVVTWRLSYEGIPTAVQQAHIHFGRRGTFGGVVAFLCTNLGNAPVQACPLSSGTISGTITPSDIIGGAAAQGIAAGEFAEVVAAIGAGAAYVNVHSDEYPGGEIRGQINLHPLR
jgi:hypothetical protein